MSDDALSGPRGLILAMILDALLERDFTFLRGDYCADLTDLADLPSGKEFMRAMGHRWRLRGRWWEKCITTGNR